MLKPFVRWIVADDGKKILQNMPQKERHWKKRSRHEIEFRLCDDSIQSWILIVWLHTMLYHIALNLLSSNPFSSIFRLYMSHRCKIHHIKKGQDRWTDGRFACQMYSPLIFNNIDNLLWDNIEVLPVLLFRYWNLIGKNNILEKDRFHSVESIALFHYEETAILMLD